MARGKVSFYVVTNIPTSILDPDESMVLTRSELINFLRSGCKFVSIRALERSDFANPKLFVQENDND